LIMATRRLCIISVTGNEYKAPYLNPVIDWLIGTASSTIEHFLSLLLGVLGTNNLINTNNIRSSGNNSFTRSEGKCPDRAARSSCLIALLSWHLIELLTLVSHQLSSSRVVFSCFFLFQTMMNLSSASGPLNISVVMLSENGFKSVMVSALSSFKIYVRLCNMNLRLQDLIVGSQD